MGGAPDAGRIHAASANPGTAPRDAGAGNLAAIAAMLISTVLYTLSDAAMKFASVAVPTGEGVFLRSLGTVLLLTFAAAWSGVLASLRQVLRPLLFWRGLGDAGNSLAFQAALARMPLADAMGILQLTPLCLTAASALLLSAKVGWRRWSAVGAGLIGALLVIKPGSGAFNIWAILVVVSVLCGTFRDLSSRRFDPALSPLVILIGSQSIVGSCALGGLLFEHWVLPAPLVGLQLGLGALFIAGGHLFALNAVRSSDLAVVAPFRYAGIVWAILLGFGLWGDLPDKLSLAGILILIAAGLYTFNRERRAGMIDKAMPDMRPPATEPS